VTVRRLVLWTCLSCGLVWQSGACAGGTVNMQENTKTRNAFYTTRLTEKAKTNAAKYPWAADMQQGLVERAEPWVRMSDDELWDLMFGPNITRSWMVWSDGYCPACKQDVRMYAWKIDPWTHPWKVQCPHCDMLFPTNDFDAFHRSGYDEHGVFQPDRADRSLLYNAEHPDPNDPLHLFGVDDGEGYIADGHRWRFIGCYLIYGQWKRWVHRGIVNLSAAYFATGDTRYAHKTMVLLDRVADLFPTFDFHEQGLVYEVNKGTRGQVSTWHDACEEVRELALAYDRVFEGVRADHDELAAFLSRKSKEYKLSNPKTAWTDIQRNIEERILRNTLANRPRIESNYPRTDVAMLVIKTVLDWPNNRDEVMALLDGIIVESTKVDGLSGEKGLTGYGTIAPRAVADILALFSRLEPGFLEALYARHPVLHQTYRFHIDTWCMDEFYPSCGDAGRFGAKSAAYVGVGFNKDPGVDPSLFSFMWDMYKLTGDADLVKVLYGANGRTVDGLPYELFADDPETFQAEVQDVIRKVGPDMDRGSVDKQQWHLAILRSGTGDDRRALWIDYDSGGRHCHSDGMNIGLFAKGVDLIPEFGYPAVGYGGWGSQIGRWYTRSAAHVTVVVDGQDQKRSVQDARGKRQPAGKTTLRADGDRFKAVRVSGPEITGGQRFERTLMMVDIDDRDFYVVDCFNVVGGKDHAKFFHSFFGDVDVQGLSLADAPEYGHETVMRNFRRDAGPAPGWSVDWRLEDRYDYLPEETEVRLRYTDLTSNAEAYLCEGWIDPGLFGKGNPEWIPRVMVRRTAETEPLASTFVGVIEPYERERTVRTIRRLPLQTAAAEPLPDTYAAVEVGRTGSRRDICIIADVENMSEVVEPGNDIRMLGELALVTIGPNGVERLALCNGQRIRVGNLTLSLKQPAGFVELVFDKPGATLAAGNLGLVESLRIDDEDVRIQPGT